MYEVLVSYLLLGIAVQLIWKSVDFMCVILMRDIMLGNGLVSEIDYNNYESYWVGMVTVPLSLLILASAGHGIDYFHMLHDGLVHVQSKVQLSWKESLRYVNRNPRKSLCRMVPFLEKHKDLARGQRQQ